MKEIKEFWGTQGGGKVTVRELDRKVGKVAGAGMVQNSF
jgi:hypothetical protein